MFDACTSMQQYISYTNSLSSSLQYIRNTLNPRWPPFKVESSTLCGSDESRSIRVQCFDWDEATDPDLIGEFYTSLAEMRQVGEGKKVRYISAIKLCWALVAEQSEPT